MKPGDKIRTIYGRIETVLRVEPRRVITEENPNRWYHITKVWAD